MLRIKLVAVLCLLLVSVIMLGGCVTRTSCIAEGTHVQTPQGVMPIEAIKVGSRIIAGDLAGKKLEATVTATFESRSRVILHLFLDNGTSLRCTPEHPIATPRGFAKAGLLAVGDRVVVADGTAGVKRIDRSESPTRVFDLSVEPGNTFFAAGVLVHNKSMAAPPTMRNVVGRWIGLDISNDWALVRYWLEVRADGTCTLTSTNQEIWMEFVNLNTELSWKPSTLKLPPATVGATTATLKFVPMRESFRAQLSKGEKEPWREVLFLREDYIKTMQDQAPSKVPQQQVQ